MSKSDSPRTHLEAVRVLSVPSGIPVCTRFLAGVLGLDTHFKGGRTIPCDGQDECPAALHRLGVIWRGYAPIEAWEASKGLWRPWVLEVTEGLEERLRGRELRGETWALHRNDDRGRSSAVIGIFCESVDVDQVRPAFDILPVLQRLYHRSHLRLGTRNPVPARVLLEALPGPAPTLPTALALAGSADNAEKDLEEAAEVWRKFRQTRAALDKIGDPNKNGKAHPGIGGVR